MPVNKECINEAWNNLKNFTKDELSDYINEVFARANSYDNLSSQAAFDKAIKEINNSRLQEFFSKTSAKAKNVAKYESLVKRIKEQGATMRTILVKRYKQIADAVSSAQRSAEGRLADYIYRNLNHEEMEYFNSGLNDKTISSILDGQKIDDPIANKIADLIKNYPEFRNNEMIRSGALDLTQLRNDRNLKAIHDISKLLNGGKSLAKSAAEIFKKHEAGINKESWINFIKQYINVEKTFKYTEAYNIETKNLDMAKVDNILSDIYDNITTGKSDIFSRSTVINDKETIQRKRHMFFVWKDWSSQVEYNRVYGRGNLFSMLRQDMQSSGNKIGMSEMFGDNPNTMYSELRKAQQEVNPKSGWWWRNTDNYFKTVMGQDRLPVSSTAANFSANVRAFTSIARLPLITLQSVSDIGYIAAFAHRMGINYFKAYTTLLKNIFDLYPDQERMHIANLYKTMVDSHLGYMGRWADANNMTELMNKISTRFFKANGLSAFDRGNKLSIMHLMSKSLFNNSDKSFGELNSGARRWISKFLDENEWDLLKKKNDHGLFTTDNVDSLTDDDLKAFQQKHNIDTPLYQLRNDLYRKVYSMFDVASENAVLSPSDFERAWCFQGEPPGTLKGELLRTITQFKMYTMAYMDRVLIQGFKDADTIGQKLIWAASMLMGTLPLSLLSVYLGNLANGLSMPNIEDMNTPEKEKFLLSLFAPSLGIFSGLLSPNHQDADMALSQLAGPTTRLLGYGLSTASALATGNPTKAAKHLGKAASYVFPIQQIPVLSPYIRNALGEEAHLEPGQTQLYGK
jgi:hypothetical protein